MMAGWTSGRSILGDFWAATFRSRPHTHTTHALSPRYPPLHHSSLDTKMRLPVDRWITAVAILLFSVAIMGWPRGTPAHIRDMIQEALTARVASSDPDSANYPLSNSATTSSTSLSAVASVPTPRPALVPGMVWDNVPSFGDVAERASRVWSKNVEAVESESNAAYSGTTAFTLNESSH
jgi:hypothetical protein